MYEFGPFALDPARRRLLRDGQHVPIPSKAFDILVALVEHRGSVVEKDELLRLVWPGVVVEEGNLSQHVFTLRKILGEASSTPQYVATVPRRGYQFVGTVREAPGPGAHAGARQTSADPQVARSLAVLPFAALSPAEGDEYLGFGMADALITRLANIRDAVVRPASAVRRYLSAPADPVAAGRELGVDLVLQGAVQRSGDRIRITVQLVGIQEQASLWGDHFDEPFAGILTVQDRIADRVAVALAPYITADERRRIARLGTTNVEAHLACLRGRYRLNRLTAEGVESTVEQFEQAIGRDPAYGLAYAGLASCSIILASAACDAPAREATAVANARAAALKAIEIDEHLADAHAALAQVKFRWDWDWREAENEFTRAIHLDAESVPAQQAYAIYLSAMGRATEALDAITRAQQLEPLSLIVNTAVGRVLYLARRHDEAIEQYRRTLELDADFGDARVGLSLAYVQNSMYDAGVQEIQRAYDLPGRRPVLLASLGYAFAAAKRIEEAEQALAYLQELHERGNVPAILLAYPCVGLGDHDQAFEWLEKGFEEHAALLVTLKVDPVFDPLRGDPRFTDLIRRMRLAD
jgi:DNA-binding winged helix-turn-helix (wHTH) protein/tetratricopeptide (TPR) repeat protein